MKHKLLFALAGAMMMSMSAFAWDAPTRPTAPTMPQYNGTWVEPETEGTYYIYNVGTGQFLGCGMDWGTRAVTTTAAILTTSDPTWNVGTNKNTILPFLLHQTDPVADFLEDETLAGTWQIMNVNTNKSANDQYLCHEGNAAWVDGNSGRRDTDKNGFWTLNKVGDAYEMLPLDGQEGNSIVYGVHLPNLASAQTFYTWTDLKNNADASALWKFVSADDAESIRAYIAEVAASDYIAAFDAFKAATAVYDAKVGLYNTLLDADKYGADATEAGAVYNNPEATVEEINAANNALKEAIKPLAVEYGCKHSSEEEPFDVTSYVMTNADFSASCDNGKTPPGWEITITGQNIGQQNRTDTNSETGLAITNFLECWIPQPGTLGNGYAGQWITGLPAGRYRLEMDATACQQSNQIPVDQLTGVYIFYGTGSYNIYDPENPVQTGEYMPQHYTFEFDFNADKLLVGLLVENTNCNWISADNFKLSAIGEMKEDPNKKGLEEAIAKAEEKQDFIVGNNIEDTGILNANQEVIDAFTATLNQAKAALVSGIGDDMKAAVENLGKATADLEASEALYKKFQDVYNKAMLTAQDLNTAGQWQELQDLITDWAEVELTEAFNAGTLTEADLESVQGKVDEIVANFLNDPEMIKPGDDLTVLIKNHDFSQGSGRDLKGDAVPGWNIVDGQLTELSPTYHNIERYHGPVNIQQVIKNLPIGSYQIGVQGFVRVDGWTDNGLPAGDESDMVLYAGVSEKKFMKLTEEYSEYAILGNGRDDEGNQTSTGDWPYDTPRSDGLGYQPNSMEGAKAYFETINPMTDKPFYLNTVSIAHAGGDLTIGVRCNAVGNLWILWDNFTLKYLGSDAIIPLIEEIQERGAVLEDLLNSGFYTADTRAKANEALKRVEKSDDLTSSEEALALLDDLKKIIDEVKEGQAIANDLMDTFQNYSEKAETAGITDEAYLNLLNEVDDKMSEESFGSVEEMKEYIKRMKEGFVPAVVATAEPGDDITAVLNNADFEAGNANYWEVNIEGGNQGFQNNATYTSTTEEGDEITLSNFVEAWRQDAILNDGDISQTIAVALPEGYYQLSCDGYAVNQGGEPAEGVQGVYLYAKVGETSMTTPIGISGTTGQPQHWTVEFHSNGVDLTTVGLLVQGANCNWTAADNFKLTYLGTEAPDAVESIAAETNAAAKTIYTIDGRQASTLRRGFNIVRRADGTVQKVLVK